ncbi:MAG TPA: hypothetical protein DCS55_07435 [Acidimicrobiaceae bacterium]|nr:hypothetical protein [Acidimicrobiaceae bacterium]
MSRRAGRAVLWLVGLVAAGGALRLAARGELMAPPLGSLDRLTAWADAHEPAAAAMAFVRLLAEVSVWYVLALSAVHVASSALRVAGGHRLADALALPGVRRLVHAGLGVGLAAASTVGGQDEVGAPDAVTMTPVAEAPLVTQHRVEAPAGTATMRPHRPSTGEGGTAVMTPTPIPRTWTVAAGESFWSTAEELLADAWGRPPSDAEVDPFWRTLVEVNRGRLVDPADPDLIHSGQVFEVPPVPSSPA